MKQPFPRHILAFDTASELLSVALAQFDPDGTIGSSVFQNIDMGLHHGTRLLDIIEATLQTTRLPYHAIDAVVCSRGPGSYTGLRIGMATAKGLSAGLNVPCVSVPTLDAFAYRYRSSPIPIAPVIDARRNRWFSALYHNGRRLSPDLDLPAAVLLAHVATLCAAPEILFVGPHAHLLAQHLNAIPDLGTGFTIASDLQRYGCALELAILGRQLIHEGGDDETQGAHYVSLSQAETTVDNGGSR